MERTTVSWLLISCSISSLQPSISANLRTVSSRSPSSTWSPLRSGTFSNGPTACRFRRRRGTVERTVFTRLANGSIYKTWNFCSDITELKVYLPKKWRHIKNMLLFTCKDVPIMISRSALGKSFVWRKYFWGRSSPKNTTSGLTVAVQNVHLGTLSFIMACCETNINEGSITLASNAARHCIEMWKVSDDRTKRYLGLLSRVRSIAQVTGSCGKTTMSFHKFVIWDATHCEEGYWILWRTFVANKVIDLRKQNRLSLVG